jgi:hypothetical protein
MRRWLLLSSYHWLVLFAALALTAGALAWMSFGLINVAMANVEFLKRHGLMAIREGGLRQAAEIGAQAMVVLLLYFVFKAIETELIHRWRGMDR